MNWGSFLFALASPIAKKVLIALGLGFITYAGLDVAVNAALDAAKSNISGMPAAVVAILSIAGVWTSMAIVAGGITARLSMMVFSRIGRVA